MSPCWPRDGEQTIQPPPEHERNEKQSARTHSLLLWRTSRLSAQLREERPRERKANETTLHTINGHHRSLAHSSTHRKVVMIMTTTKKTSSSSSSSFASSSRIQGEAGAAARSHVVSITAVVVLLVAASSMMMAAVTAVSPGGDHQQYRTTSATAFLVAPPRASKIGRVGEVRSFGGGVVVGSRRNTIRSSSPPVSTTGGMLHKMMMARLDSSDAVKEALRISKEYGANSQEARVAWDIVEELDASDNR